MQPDRNLTPTWPAALPQPDHSTLYINNGDVMQTAAVQTAAVCLGHKLKWCATQIYDKPITTKSINH